MNRRTLLRRGGAALTLALAGCNSGPGGTPTEPNGTGPVRIVDRSFEVRGVEPGTQVDEATVTFDPASGEVRVAGTIWGSDSCKTAVLDAAEYDAAADELAVSVATADREGTEDRACAQVIVEISYRATVTFEGGHPASAAVAHDGRSVTTTQRDDESAG